jgi:digeranylgeranylglycerophospholipid reductase
MQIVIIGAGPAGCYTAQLLKHFKIGSSIRIIEEHEEVGKPVSCAGIVGKQVFNNTLLPLSKASIINQIEGALIFYRDNNFLIKKPGVAYVIDRERFDKELSRGLNVECGKKLVEIKREGSGYVVNTNVDDIYADLVIGADGPKSRVRKFIDFDLEEFKGKRREGARIYNKKYYYIGMQYRIKLDNAIYDSDLNIAQVYVCEGVPFFIWIIPENKGIIRLGIIAQDGWRQLDNFIKRDNIKGEIVDKLAGIIPLGLLSNTYYKNIFLVGDAAGQIKPLTGGGIYYGLKAAEILVECIRESKFAEYDRRWKRKFGREIKFGLKARQVYEKLNHDELGKIFLVFKKNTKFIEKIANFENHSVVFKEALKNPKIFIDAGKILGRNIRKVLF